MRFFEVDSAVNAVMGAATIAQQKASAMGKQGQLSMNGFLQMLANAGIVMDYEGFKSVFDTNPQLKNVIAKFDKDTITFASDADEEQAGYEEPQTDMPDDERVTKMAKRATKARESVNESHKDYDDAQKILDKDGVEIFSYDHDGDGSAIEVYVNGKEVASGYYDSLAGDMVIDGSSFLDKESVASYYKPSVKERKLTKAEKAKLKDYEEEIPDQSFKNRYGERWKEVKYATMTKMAKKNA